MKLASTGAARQVSIRAALLAVVTLWAVGCASPSFRRYIDIPPQTFLEWYSVSFDYSNNPRYNSAMFVYAGRKGKFQVLDHYAIMTETFPVYRASFRVRASQLPPGFPDCDLDFVPSPFRETPSDYIDY